VFNALGCLLATTQRNFSGVLPIIISTPEPYSFSSAKMKTVFCILTSDNNAAIQE